MRFKKLALALLAIVALSAVIANSAMAATTGITSWYKEGVKVTEGPANALPITCTQASEFVISTTVAGSPLKVKATGAECPESKIYNQASAEGAMASTPARSSSRACRWSNRRIAGRPPP
jgi:hypothetical protein